MAMVNMNNLLNGKDSRWLQLEVCREFQRNKCTRPDTECKFAHPPANVEVQNGRVTACYDSIKGRCNREKPPCKYFHPPQHLKDQLLINGRNHLALKNALMQQMGLTPPGQPLIPGQVPAVVGGKLQFATPLTLGQPLMQATNPYLTGMPQVGSTFSPYFTPGPVMPAILGPDPTSVGSPLSVVPQTVVTQQKMPRSDRLEPVSVATAGGVDVGKKRARDPSDDILLMDMKSVGSFYYESFAFPGMVPYKRPAADKSGMPVYQPNATTYQQLMQLQQPFVPVSCEYSAPSATVTSTSLSPSGTPGCSSGSSSNAGGGTEPSASRAEEAPPNMVEKAPPPASIASNAVVPVSKPPPPPTLSLALPTSAVDAATAAKEMAQQNYAKMKMAAGINPLMALNYTGVALNKQAVVVPPPPPRFVPPPLPVQSLGFTAAAAAAAVAAASSPLSYSQPQSALGLAYNQTHASPTLLPQYPFLRPQLFPTHYPIVQSSAPLVSNGLLNNVVAQYSPLTTTATNNNNLINSVTLQPYKKMKTT